MTRGQTSGDARAEGFAFGKYVALGNDFVVILDPPGGFDGDLVRRICDRREGAGADGLVLAATVPAAEVRLALYNCDGSGAGFSGNGFRCVLAALARQRGNPGPFDLVGPAGRYRGRMVTGDTALLEIEPGPMYPRGGPTGSLSAGSGTMENDPGRRYAGGARVPWDEAKPLLEDLELPPETTVHRVDVGNPHVILGVPGPVSPEGLVERSERLDRWRLRLGPDERGTNLSLTWELAPDRCALETWERGVGRTRACASAALATFLTRERTPDQGPLCIRMAGGELSLTVRSGSGGPGRTVTMEGRAVAVFDGRWPAEPGPGTSSGPQAG